MVRIDASVGEGGGQAVRTAVVLSVITGQPAHLSGIRAGRERPGLKWQLLLFLQAVSAISDTQMTGAQKGSTELTILPGTVFGATKRFSSDVAISIPLVLDALLPVCAFAKEASDLRVDGATDVAGAMTLDYFHHVLSPRFPGARILEVRRGYFPSAGGSVRLRVEPDPPPPITALSGAIEGIKLYAVASDKLRPSKICEAALDGASSVLRRRGLSWQPMLEYASTSCDGGSLAAVATLQNGARLGVDALLTHGASPSAVGERVATRLLAVTRRGGIDECATDSTLLLLALVGGRLQVPDLTPHAGTTMAVCEKFLGQLFAIDGSAVRVDHPWYR